MSMYGGPVPGRGYELPGEAEVLSKHYAGEILAVGAAFRAPQIPQGDNVSQSQSLGQHHLAIRRELSSILVRSGESGGIHWSIPAALVERRWVVGILTAPLDDEGTVFGSLWFDSRAPKPEQYDPHGAYVIRWVGDQWLYAQAAPLEALTMAALMRERMNALGTRNGGPLVLNHLLVDFDEAGQYVPERRVAVSVAIVPQPQPIKPRAPEEEVEEPRDSDESYYYDDQMLSN